MFPFWNHLPNGLLHNRPPTRPVPLQHQHRLLLPQKDLCGQKARYPRADNDHVVDILVVVLEERAFSQLAALVQFTSTLTTFAGSSLVLDEYFLHLV